MGRRQGSREGRSDRGTDSVAGWGRGVVWACALAAQKPQMRVGLFQIPPSESGVRACWQNSAIWILCVPEPVPTESLWTVADYIRSGPECWSG